MRIRNVFLAFMLLAMAVGFTSCEKHDGVWYHKWKCLASINGRSYIDQTPVTFSPDVAVTPRLRTDSLEVLFETMLREERMGAPAYYAVINIYCDTPEEYLSAEQRFNVSTDFDLSGDDEQKKARKLLDYGLYCDENRISWARINDEIVSEGTFKISRDKNGNYSGRFTLTFSEGKLEGRFGN